MNAPIARSAREVFAYRMKEARRVLGMSQKKLGVAMGLPEDVAGVRINRYERAVHDCDTDTAQKMAKALGVSLAYLYAETDELAEIIKEFTALPIEDQRDVLATLRKKNSKKGS